MSDPVRDNLRSKLSEQTSAFLSKGGEVTSVPTGRSGEAIEYKKSQWTRVHAKKAEPKP